MSILKQSRIDAKLSIEEVSSLLNIRKHYIIALEENRLEDIPSGVYAQGYLKMYSKLLGIECAEVTLSGDQNSNDSYRNAMEFGAKNNFGKIITIMFVMVLAAWIYIIALPNLDDGVGITQHLENAEPVNYMLNIQEPHADNVSEINADLKLPIFKEISDEFNESSHQ